MFNRYDSFTERLKTIQEFCNTANQFLKLEKVEIGGIRGKVLTQGVQKIHEHFKEYYSVFGGRSYDSTDPTDKAFLKDVSKFNNKVWCLDRKLGAILTRAFDDCNGSENIFKLLQIFGDLVQRSIIALELSDKIPLLVMRLNDEMDAAQKVFDCQRERVKENRKPKLERNMPQVSGQIKFAEEIKIKMSKSMKCFKNLNHPICYSAGAELVFKKYKQLNQDIANFEEEVFGSWSVMVEKKKEEELEIPLIIREADATIKVNFSRGTISLLNEVKHFKKEFPKWMIPDSANSIFARFEELRYYSNNLDKIASLYNYLKTETNDKEYRLFESELLKIDEILFRAERCMTWNSDDITEYLEKLLEEVSELNERVRTTQENVQQILSLVSQWKTTPLFIRIDNPQEKPFLDLKRRSELRAARYQGLEEAAEKIEILIKENEKLFEVDQEDETSRRFWNVYLRHVDGLVLDALLHTVAVSLGYLLDETDERKSPLPLFATSLQLSDPEIIFQPSLEKHIVNNFFDLAVDVVDDIFNMASLIPRIGKQKNAGKDYLDAVRKHAELKVLKDDYITRVETVIKKAKEKRDSFMEYSFLWLENRKEYLHYFLNYSRQLTNKEIEQLEENEKAVKKVKPKLEQFKEQIDHYENLHDELKQLPTILNFHSWFEVDITPFKTTVLTCTKRWSYLFKKHLLDHLVQSLQELNSFIEKADEVLLTQVHEGDYDGLIKVMEYLKLVKDKQKENDEMFEPLTDIIKMLRHYGVIIPEASFVQLNELPEKWINTKRLSLFTKQAVAPLQGMEIGKLKSRIEVYERTQREYRNYFTQMKFFAFKCESPYEILAEANGELVKLEADIKELQSEAELFDLSAPKFPLAVQCRKEIRMLKQLWDQTFLVKTAIDEWKLTLWTNIDVENMDMECKKFAKDIRGFDKEMREWNLFKGLETTVKNMLTSLRAVGELQNPAIRERHWEQLVMATKVRFVMTNETSFADLLSLNLHNHEDEVQNIVDKACKEMAMEKMIKDLNATWKNMEFENEEHKRTGQMLLRASEDLIETLEENQVQVQNMLTSKFIGYFLEEISKWQKTLCLIDHIITLWFDVQRTWSHLESIFVGSDDIRYQLPVDSERFDQTNDMFRVLLKEMSGIPNVIKATSRPGLGEELEKIQSNLSLCEKALAEYLEAKRLAFPRFYFASSADLLDILSNGNQPLLVAKHLTKLFDAMAKLTMEEKEGVVSNTAIKMTAKDGEEVEFSEPCLCEGQVEKWLNRLMETMRSTIRHQFKEAMISYEENPREKWLFWYPAQVSLAGTQIFWTSEVSSAFNRLEEGYENSLKDYYKKQIGQLNHLITLLLGNLSKGDRQKVMVICTIDVHSRDVVSKMITQKIESQLSFCWQSQLRHRWDAADEDCFANICDAEFRYWHEYLGNTPRLVITPLTDRCYITLTQGRFQKDSMNN